MKALLSSFLILSLSFAACGGSDVASNEDMNAYPEQEPLMNTWQALTDAANDEDCEEVMSHMRDNLNVVEEDCEAIFTYFQEEQPEVEWSRTDWSATNEKAKIYELDGGSLTSFVKKDGEWLVDENFWTK